MSTSRKTCDDCGSVIERSGACSWCHEELLINDVQMAEHPIPTSKAWDALVERQRAFVRDRLETEASSQEGGAPRRPEDEN